MFKKVLKWIGITVLSALILLTFAYGLISWSVNNRINSRYSFKKNVAMLPDSADSSVLLRGKRLLAIKGCNECHGAHLDGQLIIDDKMVAILPASNLTRGKGGLPADFSDQDWMMALQHGVSKEGQPLWLMPSQESALMTEKDLRAIIAYCKTISPVDHILPEKQIGPMGKVLTFFDKLDLLSVEKIDHQAAAVKEVSEDKESIALGKYLSVSCTGCHRQDFRGGDPVAPGFPEVPDISPSGDPGKWTQQQFFTALRSGKKPSGKQMDSRYMPWKMTAQYTDRELASLYLYLHSIKNADRP
ncbi:MAG: c-type cytochrome [Pedobacter sp.]|uniref:c-type cytochrome n=1 Tax=Pedobacter sp. TaxID=1411316 RepID=UPI00339A478D